MSKNFEDYLKDGTWKKFRSGGWGVESAHPLPHRRWDLGESDEIYGKYEGIIMKKYMTPFTETRLDSFKSINFDMQYLYN